MYSHVTISVNRIVTSNNMYVDFSTITLYNLNYSVFGFECFVKYTTMYHIQKSFR
jgi:hypothetical protein